MSDSSWDTYTPQRPARAWWGPLVLGAGVLALAVLLFGAGLVFSMRNMHGASWVLVQDLATRLRTEDRARQLYRANPALAEAYGSEEAFLARVRELREGFRPPPQAPREGPDYRVQASPWRLWVRVKAPGGTWLDAVVDHGGPFGQARGEGLVRLILARDPEELRSLAKTQVAAIRAARDSAAWRRFSEAARTLADPGGLERLRQGSGEFQTVPSDPEAFRRILEQRRMALQALPEDPGRVSGRSSRSQRGPFRHAWEGQVSLPQGGLFRARWVNDRLVLVALD
ncbi:MAG: hypothetical protein HY823_11935 [Acidobacteria bacterium]|nr:hypothetical protein [Acidobacteriota bacterium]